MSALLRWILDACQSLGLEIDVGFVITLDNKHQINAIARIRSLGAEHGMLIFSDYEDVRPYTREIIDAGYGFSVLDEPLENEEFDLESYKELFRDWGWAGDKALKPIWM